MLLASFSALTNLISAFSSSERLADDITAWSTFFPPDAPLCDLLPLLEWERDFFRLSEIQAEKSVGTGIVKLEIDCGLLSPT